MIGGSPSRRGARNRAGDGAERLPRREAPRGLADGQRRGRRRAAGRRRRPRRRPRPGRPRRTSSGPTAPSAPPTRAGDPGPSPATAGNRPTGVPTSASSSAQTGTSGHSAASRSNASRSGRIWSRADGGAHLVHPLVRGGDTRSPGGSGARGVRCGRRVRRAAAPGSTSPRATTSRPAASASGRRWWHGGRAASTGRGGPFGTHPSAILACVNGHRCTSRRWARAHLFVSEGLVGGGRGGAGPARRRGCGLRARRGRLRAVADGHRTLRVTVDREDARPRGDRRAVRRRSPAGWTSRTSATAGTSSR